MLAGAIVALGMPGYQEMLVLLVIGLLIFGRRLPEVGRSLGKTLVQFRRGIQDFKDQVNSDADLQEAKGAVQDIKKAVDAPRVLSDPRALMREAFDEPAPEASSPKDETAGPANP